MARKKRDYKTEYAAAKRRAQAAGYKSQREYKAVRKSLSLPPRTSPVPKRVIESQRVGVTSAANDYSRRMSRLRREARSWSDKHSHIARSRYTPSMSDEQVSDYHNAYVERPTGLSRRKAALEKRRRIHHYLSRWFNLTPEWDPLWRSG